MTELTHSFVDYNECVDGTAQCAHNCTDIIGGYNCSCRDGYELEPDGHNCTGKTDRPLLHTPLERGMDVSGDNSCTVFSTVWCYKLYVHVHVHVCVQFILNFLLASEVVKDMTEFLSC